VIRSTAALSASAYLSIFFLGVGNTVIGAASGNIGLDASQIGLAQNLGFSSQSSWPAFKERIWFLGFHGLVRRVFGAAFIFIGIKSGLTGVLTTFLLRLRQYDQMSSKLGLILFLTEIAFGRAVLGFFARTDRIRTMLLALAGACGVLSAPLLFIQLSPSATSVALLLLGLSVSFPPRDHANGCLVSRNVGNRDRAPETRGSRRWLPHPALSGVARLSSLEGSLLVFRAFAVAAVIMVLLTPRGVLRD